MSGSGIGVRAGVAGVQVCRCAGVQVCRCAGVRVCGCAGERGKRPRRRGTAFAGVFSIREGHGVIMAGTPSGRGFFYGSLQSIHLIHFRGRVCGLPVGCGSPAGQDGFAGEGRRRRAGNRQVCRESCAGGVSGCRMWRMWRVWRVWRVWRFPVVSPCLPGVWRRCCVRLRWHDWCTQP